MDVSLSVGEKFSSYNALESKIEQYQFNFISAVNTRIFKIVERKIIIGGLET